MNMVLCLGSSTDVYMCVLRRMGFTLENLPLTCPLWTSLSTQLCDGQTEFLYSSSVALHLSTVTAGQRSTPESLLLTAWHRFELLLAPVGRLVGRNKCLFSGVHTRMGYVLHSHSASRLECGWFKLIAVALNPAFAALSFVVPSLLCLLLPPPQTPFLHTHLFEKEIQHFINLGACWIAKDKLCHGPLLIRTTRQSRVWRPLPWCCPWFFASSGGWLFPVSAVFPPFP